MMATSAPFESSNDEPEPDAPAVESLPPEAPASPAGEDDSEDGYAVDVCDSLLVGLREDAGAIYGKLVEASVLLDEVGMVEEAVGISVETSGSEVDGVLIEEEKVAGYTVSTTVTVTSAPAMEHRRRSVMSNLRAISDRDLWHQRI